LGQRDEWNIITIFFSKKRWKKYIFINESKKFLSNPWIENCRKLFFLQLVKICLAIKSIRNLDFVLLHPLNNFIFWGNDVSHDNNFNIILQNKDYDSHYKWGKRLNHILAMCPKKNESNNKKKHPNCNPMDKSYYSDVIRSFLCISFVVINFNAFWFSVLQHEWMTWC